MKIIFQLILLFILLNSCNNNEYRGVDEQNSFCYWKTSLSFYLNDSELLTETSANHIYLRYFDVGWDPISKQAKPISTLSNRYDSIPVAKITPSIFLSNNVFISSSKNDLDTLAHNIKKRIENVNLNSIRDSLEKKYNEILIDCDWSQKSKENYFYFLNKLKTEIPDKHITSTLRLWQYKNPEISGIPPVDRVLLMCYNIESANNYEVENSIVSIDEIKKYTKGVSYPLKIDIALPIFSWGVLFRDQKFKGIVRDISSRDYLNSNQYEKISDNRFRLKEEMVIGNFFARPGDEIRIEMLSKEELKELASYLLSEVKTDKHSRITFFSWNKTFINNYGTNEIKDIYNIHR